MSRLLRKLHLFYLFGRLNFYGISLCLACHLKCSKCTEYETCSECSFSGTQTPDCDCVNSN